MFYDIGMEIRMGYASEILLLMEDKRNEVIIDSGV
jgi:hypothetical protein